MRIFLLSVSINLCVRYQMYYLLISIKEQWHKLLSTVSNCHLTLQWSLKTPMMFHVVVINLEQRIGSVCRYSRSKGFPPMHYFQSRRKWCLYSWRSRKRENIWTVYLHVTISGPLLASSSTFSFPLCHCNLDNRGY